MYFLLITIASKQQGKRLRVVIRDWGLGAEKAETHF
jgi:hypothetical protein